MRLLRTAANRPLDADDAAASEPRQVWVRRATRDDQPLLTMHCFSRGTDYVVASEIYPADGMHVEPLRAGPYVFASQHEAEAFAGEASRVLQYLGCEVTESDA